MMKLTFEPIIKDKKEVQKERKILPWIEKYRPADLTGILYHDRIIKMLKTYITKKSFPHLMFYGPPGTGKTSTIMACARELYGPYYNHMVLELNASDDRGIDVVRTRIRKFVMADNVFFGQAPEDQKGIFKLVILDETDAMTYDAQAILRKVVEKYSYNARFCLICNSSKKIITPLQSRCAMYRFAPLGRKVIVDKIFQIAELENVEVTQEGAELIARRSKGDMRQVLNILQTVSMAYDLVNDENIAHCLCSPRKKDIQELIHSLFEESFEVTHHKIKTYQASLGVSLEDIIDELELIVTNSILDQSIFPDISTEKKAQILSQMRVIEMNLSTATNNAIQLYGLVSIFKVAINT